MKVLIEKKNVLSYPIIVFLTILAIGLTYYTYPSVSQLGLIYFESFEYDKAYSFLAKASELSIDNVHVYKKLKDYMLLKGDVPKALELQKKLATLRKNNLEYHQELSKLYAWAGKEYERLIEEEKILDLKHLTLREKKEILLELAEGHRWIRNYKDSTRIYLQLIPLQDKKINHQALVYFAAIDDLESLEILFKTYQEMESLSAIDLQLITEALFFTGHYIQSIPYAIWSYRGKKWNATMSDFSYLNSNIALDSKKRSSLEIIYQSIGKSNGWPEAYRFQESILAHYPNEYQIRHQLMYSYQQLNGVEAQLKLLPHIRYFKKSIHPLNEIIEVIGLLETRKDFSSAIQILLNHKDHQHIGLEEKEWILQQLAQLYEAQGDQQQALKYYNELLKLRERSYYSNTIILYAKNDLIKNDVTFIKEKKRTNSRLPKKIDLPSLRLKIADLGEQQKKVDLSIEQLQKIEAENPVDLSILEKLAERYQWYGKREKSIEIYHKILRISPTHELANLQVALDDYDKGHSVEAHQRLTIIEYSPLAKSIEFRSVLEEVSFKHGDRVRQNTICQNYLLASFEQLKLIKSSEEQSLIFRCLYRSAEKDRAMRFILWQISQNNSIELYRTAIDLALELKELSLASTLLKSSKSIALSDTQLLEAEYYLDELIWHDNQQINWKFLQSNKLVELNQFSVYKAQFDLTRNATKNWRWGVNFFNKKALAAGDISYSSLGPILTYGDKQQTIELSYREAFGDRHYDSPGLLGEWNFSIDTHTSIGVSYINSEIEDLTSELFAKKDLDKKVAQLFLAHSNVRLHGYFSSQINFLKDPTDKGSNSIHYLEGYYDLKALPLSYGIKSSYQKSSFKNDKLKQFYLSESFPQYLFLKSNFKHKHTDWMNISGEVYSAVGQDPLRKMNFGKLLNFGMNGEILLYHTYHLQTQIDYYNYSYLGTTGHFQIVQLNLGTIF